MSRSRYRRWNHPRCVDCLVPKLEFVFTTATTGIHKHAGLFVRGPELCHAPHGLQRWRGHGLLRYAFCARRVPGTRPLEEPHAKNQWDVLCSGTFMTSTATRTEYVKIVSCVFTPFKIIDAWSIWGRQNVRSVGSSNFEFAYIDPFFSFRSAIKIEDACM